MAAANSTVFYYYLVTTGETSTPEHTRAYYGTYGFENGYFLAFDMPFEPASYPFMALINLATGELAYQDNPANGDIENHDLILSLAREINIKY